MEKESKKYELRQQLSSDSLRLITSALNRDIGKLENLSLELAGLTKDSLAFDKLNEEIKKLENAKIQVANLFVDQFEAGREENDMKGNVGLKIVKPKKKYKR